MTSANGPGSGIKSWATCSMSRAYERTSLFVTTNLLFEQWTEVLGGERLGTWEPRTEILLCGVLV